MGPMRTFIAAMKVVPMGCIALPLSGASAPSATPMTMATRTCTYNCRYQGFRVRSGAGAACVMATS